MKAGRASRLLWLCVLAIAASQWAHAASAADVATFTQAEAAPSGWNAAAPPATGWVPVKLLDYWTRRWPSHDGVVWYRIRWRQPAVDAPVGLLLHYVNAADAVWVNGTEVHRDAHLVEPLTQGWHTPQYIFVPQPLLRAGDNTLLVRVSGLAAYRPGLGTVQQGDAVAVHKLYRRAMRQRYDIHLFNLALAVIVAPLFGVLWLLRREQTVFGWYALTTLFDALFGWSFVSTSIWPFTSTDAQKAFVGAVFVAVVASFVVFLLRFSGRRLPRTEAALGLATLAAFVFALAAPHVMGPQRWAWIAAGIVVYYSAIVAFLWHALRTPRVDVRVLGACLLLSLMASLHDVAVYFGWWQGGNGGFNALASPLLIIGMGFAVAWRFAHAMRRIEGFNAELKREVKAATRALSDTLSQRHALELAHARAGERLQLVRDLHDGFGGSLLGAIGRLEQKPSPEAAQAVATLQGLRADLRLVIDTTTHASDTDLAGLVAGLRRDWRERFEDAGIVSRWRLDGLRGLQLGPAYSLNLLRVLQEALTNVLKHSDAAHVDVSAEVDGAGLHVEVRDDGRGFDTTVAGRGMGLANMRTRAQRLDGEMFVDAQPGGGTHLHVDLPLPAAACVSLPSAAHPD